MQLLRELYEMADQTVKVEIDKGFKEGGKEVDMIKPKAFTAANVLMSLRDDHEETQD